MRILDLFKGYGPKAAKQLELDERQAEAWPQELAKHLQITQAYSDLVADIEEERRAAEATLKRFTDEEVLTSIPERARTMSALHGHEFASQTRKLLAAAAFSADDIFSFEKQQDAYFEANSAYKDLTAKNVSALHEFFADELKATQERLQRIEDGVINAGGTLEARKFPQVRKVKELLTRIAQGKERGERYAQLLASLEQDHTRTKEKRIKLEKDMQAQLSLIRNEQALAALQKAERVEQELHDIAARYVSICDDLRNIYKKSPAMKPSAKLKHVFDELPKEPLVMLAQESAQVQEAFEDAIAQLEEENPGNVKNMINRLSKLAREADATGRKVSTTLPDQRALKRDIMKDIAALQSYDKQQFVMRAKTEEDAIAAKIAYIKDELDPGRLDAMRQEMKAMVRDLGATIKGDSAVDATKGKEDVRDDSKKEPPKVEVVDIEEKDEKENDKNDNDKDGAAQDGKKDAKHDEKEQKKDDKKRKKK